MAARLASKAQFDARALAHQATRENLVDPRRPSSTEMLSGGSATPSMGLSQIRGGRAKGSTKAFAPGKLGATCGMAGGCSTGGECQDKAPASGMFGTKKGGAKAHHEPLLLGRELAEHLVSTKGPAFARAFTAGLMHGEHHGEHHGGNLSHSGAYEGKGGLHGGGWLDWYDNIDWEAPWSWEEFGKGFVKGAVGTTRAIASIPGVILDYVVPGSSGVATAVNKGLDYLGLGKGKKKLKGGSGIVGGGSWDNEPGPDTYDNSALDSQRAAAETTAAKAAAIMGGRRRRAPAKAGDGRRSRAEVVKRVMQEKGLKLIDASRYVKAHNLWSKE